MVILDPAKVAVNAHEGILVPRACTPGIVWLDSDPHSSSAGLQFANGLPFLPLSSQRRRPGLLLFKMTSFKQVFTKHEL